MTLKVKNAQLEGTSTSFITMLLLVIMGSFSIALFTLSENVLLNAGICFVLLLFFMFLMSRDGKRHEKRIRTHVSFLENDFKCKDCKRIIEEPVEFKRVDGQPVLYHCDSCNILWFKGLYSQS